MRIKRFDISTRFLKDIFSGQWIKWRVIENALPEDAEIIGIVPCNPMNGELADALKLYVMSNSYPDLPELADAEPLRMVAHATEGIENIVDSIEFYANRYVGIDSGLHHPDAVARLHAAGMEVDAEIMRRMAKLNEGVK